MKPEYKEPLCFDYLEHKNEKGGRPNCDVILMIKIQILQHWYGMSDLEVERQRADRISFMGKPIKYKTV
jgi:IS5 family transposase